MAAHRYWRLEVFRRDTSVLGYIAMRSLDLRAVAGGPALSVVSATASIEDPAFPAANLIDGNDATAWDSGLLRLIPAVLTFELAAPAEVVQLRVHNTGNADRRPGRARVLGSDDGQAWVRYATEFDGTNQPIAADFLASVNSQLASDGPRVSGTALRLDTFWPAQPLAPRTTGQALRVGHNVGAYRVAGNVYIDGTPDVPVSRRVRLFDRATAVCAREVWSDATTGAYLFDKLPMPADGYFVVTHDHLAVFNAVVKDRITPVL